MKTYMLDTCICSFIMREKPLMVLERLDEVMQGRNRIVISAITYAEMRYGQIGKKASPKHKTLVDEFILRLHDILPWNKAAIDATIHIRGDLAKRGISIGNNDTAIAGHAIAANCILITNNTREFGRVAKLKLEDWSK